MRVFLESGYGLWIMGGLLAAGTVLWLAASVRYRRMASGAKNLAAEGV